MTIEIVNPGLESPSAIFPAQLHTATDRANNFILNFADESSYWNLDGAKGRLSLVEMTEADGVFSAVARGEVMFEIPTPFEDIDFVALEWDSNSGSFVLAYSTDGRLEACKISYDKSTYAITIGAPSVLKAGVTVGYGKFSLASHYNPAAPTAPAPLLMLYNTAWVDNVSPNVFLRSLVVGESVAVAGAEYSFAFSLFGNHVAVSGSRFAIWNYATHPVVTGSWDELTDMIHPDSAEICPFDGTKASGREDSIVYCASEDLFLISEEKVNGNFFTFPANQSGGVATDTGVQFLQTNPEGEAASIGETYLQETDEPDSFVLFCKSNYCVSAHPITVASGVVSIGIQQLVDYHQFHRGAYGDGRTPYTLICDQTWDDGDVYTTKLSLVAEAAPPLPIEISSSTIMGLGFSTESVASPIVLSSLAGEVTFPATTVSGTITKKLIGGFPDMPIVKVSTGIMQKVVNNFITQQSGGVIHIYDDSAGVPANSDAAETGVLLAVVSKDGLAHVAGNAENGLVLEPTGGSVGALQLAAANSWSGKWLTTGTPLYFRCYDVEVITGASTASERFDGGIVVDAGGDTSLAPMVLTSGNVVVGADFNVDSFNINIVPEVPVV
ncbi:hypothetical protein [Desulfotalea psychrophila]|uniref:Uncharacterized protein n=1 Tax=Desulfotalea psychrophila (strain LSv54 / DSM 12343) TaxID=177439 RepID=Q6ALP9_DESPS|nr:hypothetical protein [Desulfotalea psychrophila]CAG36726.1 unknown protein [Desulfotalea psychrophila LSv54]